MLTTTRIAALVALAALGFAAWRIASPATQARNEVAQDVTAVTAQATAARFTVATANLDLQQRSLGSYAGAAMPDGVTLVRGDEASYCVQLTGPGTVMHLAGPGGIPSPGAC